MADNELHQSERALQVLPKAEAQVAPSSSSSAAGAKSEPSNSAAAVAMANQQAAYAIAQEANKLASKLNAELCRNFSIGTQHENGGAFTSPNYPNPYPLNLICTRLIEGKLTASLLLPHEIFWGRLLFLRAQSFACSLSLACRAT